VGDPRRTTEHRRQANAAIAHRVRSYHPFSRKFS
jgi:hypothetical protein